MPPPRKKHIQYSHQHPLSLLVRAILYMTFSVPLSAFAMVELDHNIALTNHSGTDIRHYADGLTININATGSIYENNWEDKGYENSFYWATAALVWQGNTLTVGTNSSTADLKIVNIPAPWQGNKIEERRVGLMVQTGGKVNVFGNTSILIDNYKNSESDSDLDEEHDYGMHSQKGIDLMNDESDVHFTGDLEIEMSDGNRSIGILARDGAALTVDGNTSISVRDSTYYTYGIANQYDDQGYGLNYLNSLAQPLQFNGDLTIATHGGNNSIGINFKNNGADGRYDAITVKGHTKITATGANNYDHKTDLQVFPQSVSNYGMFFYNAGAYFDSAEILVSSYDTDTNSYREGVESIGVYSYWGSYTNFYDDAVITAQADDQSVSIAVLSRGGSEVDFKKGLIAKADVVLNAVSNNFLSQSIIQVNSEKDPLATVHLTGNIVIGKTDAAAVWGGDYDPNIDSPEARNLIEVNFLNKNSSFTGVNEYGTTDPNGVTLGTINLNFANQARWNMTDNSRVNLLTLNGQAVVDLTYGKPRSTADYRVLEVEQLNGNDGIFIVNTDIAAEKTDQVVIEKGHGQHQVYVIPSGAEPSREIMDTFIVKQSKGDAQFVLGNEGHKVEHGLYFYEMAQRTTSDDESEWYLVRSNLVNPDPEDPDVPIDPDIPSIPQQPETPTGVTEAALSSLAGQYAMWNGQLTDLRRRLGDVHDGEQTGVWMRGFFDNSELDGFGSSGFSQRTYGGSLGYDTTVFENSNYRWLLGFQIRGAHAKQSVKGRWDGSGHISSYGLGAYSTWLHNNGAYLDAVVTADWYDQTISATMLDGSKVSDSHSSLGLGASVETGIKYRLGITNDELNYWFIEPQVQLSYFWINGGDYVTSNDMSIDQGDLDSLTLRGGCVLGHKFSFSRDARKWIEPYVKAGVAHEFLGDQIITLNGLRMSTDYEDTHVYFGLGLDWQATENMRIYVQAERENGTHYERNYNVSAGMKLIF